MNKMFSEEEHFIKDSEREKNGVTEKEQRSKRKLG